MMDEVLALHLRRLRLRHLEILLTIARHGSLTAAAEALDATQPAVSQWLAEIEAALEVPLFVRGRQIQPTKFLPVAVRHARRIVMESHLLESELEAVQRGIMGRVRIGCMLVATSELLPKLLMALRAGSTPPLQFTVVEDTAAGLWDRFDRDELDLFVGRLDERAYRLDVLSEVLFSDTHRVVANRKHPLLKATRLGWSDVVGSAWILPPPSTPLRQAVDATFLNNGLPTPTPWLETTSLSLIQELLQDPGSLGILSGAAALRSRRLGLLECLPLQLISDVGPIGMVWKRNEPGPALDAVLQALQASAPVAEAQGPAKGNRSRPVSHRRRSA